jgi:hypothetical protein
LPARRKEVSRFVFLRIPAGWFANDNRYHSSSIVVAAADVNFLGAQATNGFVTNGLLVSKPFSSTASSRASDRRD